MTTESPTFVPTRTGTRTAFDDGRSVAPANAVTLRDGSFVFDRAGDFVTNNTTR